jgi:hypothetical protein
LLKLLGNLPTTTYRGLLAPFSARAYTFDSNGTVRVFDLAKPTAGGLPPEILPAITPTANPESIDQVPAMRRLSLFLCAEMRAIINVSSSGFRVFEKAR